MSLSEIRTEVQDGSATVRFHEVRTLAPKQGPKQSIDRRIRLTAVATDAVGWSTTAPPVTVVLDTTAPSVTIEDPASGSVVATPRVTVTGSVSDANLASVTVGPVTATVEGTRFTAPDVPLAEGDNFLVAVSWDGDRGADVLPLYG